MKNVIQSYFQKLFTNAQGNMELVLQCVRPKVEPTDNEDLVWDFSQEDVKDAIFFMHPDKAPRKDSLNSWFFQKCWSVIRGQVMKIVL